MKQIMIKYLCVCSFLLLGINTYSQQTSLIVENQSPGWLSNKIGYEDQQTVERLKVSGYINGTDINFLVQLQSEYKLRILDLSDASIVKGGEKVFISKWLDDLGNMHYNEVNIQENNYLYRHLYLAFTNLNKLSTPKSDIYADEYGVCVNADTVIVNGQYNKIRLFPYYYPGRRESLPSYRIKSLELTEGLDSVALHAYHTTYSNQVWNYEKLVIPSTIKKIADLCISGGNIVSFIEHPEKVTFINFKKIEGDTIFIPEGTTTRYQSSKFQNMKTFIEMNAPNSIKIVPSTTKLYKGETLFLSTIIEPERVYYKDLIWETSDSNIATISPVGEVTALSAGSVIITVSSAKKPDVKAQCSVNVYEHTTGVSISLSETTLHVGYTVSLSANTLPQGISDNEIIWSTSNPAIATIDNNGNVKAINQGNCVIKAMSVDGGYTAECKITVVQPAETVSLNKNSLSLIVGTSETLTAIVKPDNTTDKTVLWSSSNTNSAIVDSNGKVTAKKAGECIITATAKSNPEAKATCNVTVIQPVTGISLSENQLKMSQLGEMKQLTANVLPEDATNKTVNWTSSNTGVCTVSNNGTVVATGYGEATVVATTVDGNFPAACVVKVSNSKYKLTYIVDGEVYKTYEIEFGSTITPEAEPTKEGYTFSGWSEIPETMPDHDVTVTGTFTQIQLKCATPTIKIENGQLKLSCETPGVTYVTSYTAEGVFNTKNGNEVVTSGSVVCHLSVYATKKDYQNSDIATTDVELFIGKKGDVNQDGVVTITDAVSVVNIILNEDGTISAPAMESPAVEAPEVANPE